MHYYFIQIILIGSILLLLFLDWCQCSNHQVVCSVYKIKYIIGIAFLFFFVSVFSNSYPLCSPRPAQLLLGLWGFSGTFFFFSALFIGNDCWYCVWDWCLIVFANLCISSCGTRELSLMSLCDHMGFFKFCCDFCSFLWWCWSSNDGCDSEELGDK